MGSSRLRLNPARKAVPLSQRRAEWAVILLIGGGLLAYANSFAGPFVFDDHRYIVENPAIRRLRYALLPPPGSDVIGRPVVSLSLALNYALHGLQVYGYHAVNVVLHLAAGLLLFGVLRRLFRRSGWEHGAADWTALTAAALWLVHPLQTQAVSYVIQRSELLMGFAYLATLYALARAADASGPGWRLAAVAACALGMGSKAVMVTAPVAALVFDRAYLAGSFRGAWRDRGRLHLALMATWGILAAQAALGAAPLVNAAAAGPLSAPLEYAATQAGVILHYLRLAWWPAPLIFDYGWPVVRSISEGWKSVSVAALVLAAAAWAWRRDPRVGFLGVWFALVLAPTSTVFPLPDAAFEHRMYLPLISPVVGTVLAIRAGLARWRVAASVRTAAAAALAVAALLALVTATVRRNAVYQDAVVLWRDTVAHRPQHARAHHNLGYALAEAGELTEAIASYREAIRLQPRFAQAHSSLGGALARRGNADAEAEAALREALRIDPSLVDARGHLGNLRLVQGRFEEAVAEYGAALKAQPWSTRFHNNLGIALMRLGRQDEAMAQFEAALRVDPSYERAKRNLALVRPGAAQSASP